MKSVIIAGGSGTIGQRLSEILEEQGYKPLILTRNDALVSNSDQYVHWDIDDKIIGDQFEKGDYIINLAGAGIADGRWTQKRKKLILESRIKTTQLLISEIARRKMTIKGFVNASAIGYYGDGGSRKLTEESSVITKEFLSNVCVAWEEEALKAKSICDKLSILRIGTVLSKTGGALEKMDQSIPFGIASYLGNGKQLMSWIHIDDLCHMIIYVMNNNLSGIFNAVAPEILSNKEFTNVLRRKVNKKAILVGAPTVALKLALGEMSRVVLNSSNVDSSKILNAGFDYLYPNLEGALDELYKE